MQRIGLIYDPHIVAETRSGYGHDGVEVVREAIEKLNAVGVDWTVVGGDCRTFITPTSDRTAPLGTWDGDPDDEYYREDFEKAKRIFDEHLDSEYFVIRGNNDRPLEVFRDVFPAADHPQWFWFVEDGARYVFLDSNPHQGYHHLTENQNFVSAPQISMLQRLVDEDPTVPTFVFVHAPLAKHEELRDDWETGVYGGYYVTVNHPAVQRVLGQGNVVFVNSGHYYPDSGRGSTVVDGVEYVLARHLVQSSDPEYAGDVRWLTVDADSRSATVHYRDLDAGEDGILAERTW
jgi:hypothetical protein